ncbi:MAG TPA: PIN domain-containing protein [Chloroflexota bacterium]|nr:PIN domain-containing protein [Chloroflexota bacterium]
MASAELDRALAGATRVLLDSSTLIAFHSPREEVHPLARHLLARIEDNTDPLAGYFSSVSAMELLVRPIKAGGSALTFMHAFLSSFPNLTLLPVDLEVAIQAATLRAVTAVESPDALTVASGLLANCEAIIFNDEAWGKRIQPHFRQFRWIYLRTYK